MVGSDIYLDLYSGCRLVYLPEYSPDMNPIEEGFSAMKAWIRAYHHHVLGEFMGDPECDPYGVLYRAVHESMTPAHIRGWFYGCGYVASK
ncbi:hypothetical protein L226DRAFT_474496 [Lentinus tigrinus ALCF2SS1-7]|uniref:uncharacterized protein n=1 Tax=Lentinus tigrinus ALCF2SS1-7 TaxID=1328758 RepID=UPI0011662050|nr:hypothetical protein L226DRAFT_474496 [Lentinus tigrinus ALCF2SS1-7]